MVYHFEKQHTLTFELIVESDSLEEAKEMANESDEWEETDVEPLVYCGHLVCRSDNDQPIKDLEEFNYLEDNWCLEELSDDDFYDYT